MRAAISTAACFTSAAPSQVENDGLGLGLVDQLGGDTLERHLAAISAAAAPASSGVTARRHAAIGDAVAAEQLRDLVGEQPARFLVAGLLERRQNIRDQGLAFGLADVGIARYGALRSLGQMP